MYFYLSIVREKIACLVCNKGVSVPKEYTQKFVLWYFDNLTLHLHKRNHNF